MSEPFTFAAQRRRLGQLGMALHELPALLDVDTIDDARAVAREASDTRFARVLATIESPRRARGRACRPRPRR